MTFLVKRMIEFIIGPFSKSPKTAGFPELQQVGIYCHIKGAI